MRMRNGGGRGQGGAARPAGRMQDQHVVDRASARATDAVESWGPGVLYQMQPGSKRSRTLSTS